LHAILPRRLTTVLEELRSMRRGYTEKLNDRLITGEISSFAFHLNDHAHHDTFIWKKLDKIALSLPRSHFWGRRITLLPACEAK